MSVAPNSDTALLTEPADPPWRSKLRRRDPQRMAYGAGAIFTVLLIWWLLTGATGAISPDLFPSPLAVVRRFAEMMVTPYSGHTLPGHAIKSLSRWFPGVAISVLIGVPLGVLLAWVPFIRAGVAPAFEVLRYIPPFAWIPIAVLFFGPSLEAQAAVVFVAAFPVCVINTQTGIAQIDPIYERAALTLGSGQIRTLRRIMIPQVLPMIATGLRIAMSNGWMALVGAELVVGNAGLGFLIEQGQVNDSTSTIVVGMVAIGLIGFAIDIVMQVLQRAFTAWRPE